MAQSQQAKGGGSGSMKSHLVFGVIGLIVGVSISEDLWGAFSGACLGFLFSNWNSSHGQLAELRRMLSAVEEQQTDLLRRVGGELVSDSPSRPDPQTEATDLISTEAEESATLEDAVASAFSSRTNAPAPPEPRPVSSPTAPPARSKPSGPSPIVNLIGAVRSFFLGGNTIVRTGLLVLLVGLTLLAKYAADNALFPVEARLSFAALVGLGLVGLGFRQRISRPGFGMSLQGGGIAALYVVTFFAFKFYALVPAGLAFSLFVGLATATAILSVLQRSEPLLVIGSLGGFLAPILASTGEGNHVALFSYYLLLNFSIAFVAWWQTWRLPALVAFACTYGVAATWGVLRYEPENFSSTEPFVLAFMFLFTGIAVLHAWRKPPQLRGIIDGTLIFGTPFISIMFQSALVRDRELGLALSAAGFGLFYAVWAILVWRAAPREVRPLAEAFIALGVGFATMAVPFAFDEALTTSVAWALEGAGLYWIGARQSRAMPRVAGLALQILAGAAFSLSVALEQVDSSTFVPIANGRALSCLSLAMAGIFIARQAYVSRATLRQVETDLAQLFGIWGLAWWTGGALAEITQFVPFAYQPSACLAWLAATAVGLELGSQRSGWAPGRLMALASLPGAALLLIPTLDQVPHLLADGGWIAWPLVFGAFHFLWEHMGETHDRWLETFRAGCLWLLAVVSALALGGLAEVGFELAIDWQIAGFGVGIAIVLLGSCSLLKREHSPFNRSPQSAQMTGLGPIAGFALLTVVGFQLAARGDASPLPHIPLLNPVDLVVWLLALSVWRWWRGTDGALGDLFDATQRRLLALVLLMVAFACLNGLLARAVHQWAGVPFGADSLWDSSAMQVTLSIAWTLTGMIGMLLSSRRGWRGAWMGFAGLLAVVVFKLFTVDLSQLGTLVRIGTFLAVGALLLVLGYVSPVPPSVAEHDAATGSAQPPGDA